MNTYVATVTSCTLIDKYWNWQSFFFFKFDTCYEIAIQNLVCFVLRELQTEIRNRNPCSESKFFFRVREKEKRETQIFEPFEDKQRKQDK